MKYGNCLIGAIILALTVPSSGKIIRRGTHFYYRTNEGVYHHFKLEKDILPFPLCFVLFKGNFTKERNNE